MLAGIDFYRAASQLIAKHKPAHLNVEQQIQTNGVLINEAWCALFKEHDMQIGVSLDGPEAIHNANRVNWRGRGSFDLTMRGVRALQTHGIPFHALFVVSQFSLDHAREIFEFYLHEEIDYVGFNIEELTGANQVSFLTEKRRIEARYQAFLSTLMDLWMEFYPKLRIREFERLQAYLHRKLHDPSFSATTIEASEKGILTINLDGGIVPFSPDLASGTPEDPEAFVVEHIQNIGTLSEIYTLPKFQALHQSILKGVEKCRGECPYFDFCGGGHPTNKYFENRSFATSQTRFCELYFQQMTDCFLSKFTTQEAHAAH